jgi:uncharacterized protein
MGEAKYTAQQLSPWGVGATLVWGAIAVLPWMIPFPDDWSWLDTAFGSALLTIFSYLFLVGVVILAVRVAGCPVLQYLGLLRPSMHDVALGIAVQGILSIAAFVVIYGVRQFGLVTFMQPNLMAAPAPPTILEMVWLIFLSGVLIGPICEEILVRGFMYRGLAQSWLGPAGAVMVSSIFFAIVHREGNVFWHFISAMLFGALRWRTGSLTAPIAAHIFSNAAFAAIGFWHLYQGH